ncbi:MAG: hypothetical protein AAF694_18190 [Bacteroidota bacterium]
MVALIFSACTPQVPIENHQSSFQEQALEMKIQGRSFPSVFQAWYGIDMPQLPRETLSDRLALAAKHDILWEEPLSQLGEGVDLVLGLEWEGEHHGLSRSFEKNSLSRALENRQALLTLNPHMVFLMEIRWRDAPMSFFPAESEYWKRDENGKVIEGWLGGWEPFYMLDYDNEAFQDNVAAQAKLALESGVYDGIMLDWSGHLSIIQKVREAIGEQGLIIVNIHDDIEDGKKYREYINGSFMELNPLDQSTLTTDDPSLNNLRKWDTIREALLWFEEHLQEPQINCLEVWGARKDLQRMRATSALALTHSDGYVLYGDPNPLKTPDHLHDWYDFWEVDLGRPTGELEQLPNQAYRRSYDHGWVYYNHYGNGAVEVKFEQEMRRISDGQVATSFRMEDRDGEIFTPLRP